MYVVDVTTLEKQYKAFYLSGEDEWRTNIGKREIVAFLQSKLTWYNYMYQNYVEDNQRTRHILGIKKKLSEMISWKRFDRSDYHTEKDENINRNK